MLVAVVVAVLVAVVVAVVVVVVVLLLFLLLSCSCSSWGVQPKTQHVGCRGLCLHMILVAMMLSWL